MKLFLMKLTISLCFVFEGNILRDPLCINILLRVTVCDITHNV